VEYRGVNVDALQFLADEKNLQVIDIQVLIDNGLVNKKDKVKVLGRGELTAKLDVTAHAFSETAVKLIEAQGGSTTIV